jgi:hypothetical protein
MHARVACGCARVHCFDFVCALRWYFSHNHHHLLLLLLLAAQDVDEQQWACGCDGQDSHARLFTHDDLAALSSMLAAAHADLTTFAFRKVDSSVTVRDMIPHVGDTYAAAAAASSTAHQGASGVLATSTYKAGLADMIAAAIDNIYAHDAAAALLSMGS